LIYENLANILNLCGFSGMKQKQRRMQYNMRKTISKTLDEVMQNLPEKPFREFPDDFEPDTSDIAEITGEELKKPHFSTPAMMQC